MIYKGEEYKQIPAFPDYSVSRKGEVLSMRKGYPVILSHRTNKTPYGKVGLFATPRQSKTFRVHDLVLVAWVGEPPNKQMQCRHLNGNPKDNRLENLSWGTVKENIADKKRHGTELRGENRHNSVFTNNEIVAIRLLYRREVPGKTFAAIARKYKTVPSVIYNIVKYKTYPA